MSSGDGMTMARVGRAGHSAAGFTLLEVIVSMVLISMVGMAAYALISSNVSNLGHIKEHLDRVQLVRNALAFMEQINPMDDKTGVESLGPYRIAWKAKLVVPRVRDSENSFYIVGLYKTHITIRLKAKDVVAFDILQVGYYRRVK